jgi:two-component system response regulator VicR
MLAGLFSFIFFSRSGVVEMFATGADVARPKVLVVDDEPDLVRLVAFVVEDGGLSALGACDAPTALRLLAVEAPNLVVLDVNLAALGDGFELLAELRRRSNIPVILLTARLTEDDKVRGLDLGADDYMVKPFNHRELLARIRAQLRRTARAVDEEGASVFLRVGPLTMNVGEFSVRRDGRSVPLTRTEFRLLHYLMSRASSVVPTAAIARDVWGYDDAAAREVVRVTLHRLRRKLGEDASAPALLHTVPGVGVMLKPYNGDGSPSQ